MTVVHVIGATGRTGEALCRALLAAGHGVVPVVRNPTKWDALGLGAAPFAADLHDPGRLAEALREATRVVFTVHASETGRVLAAAPPAARVVILGSTRRFSPLPGAHGLGVARGEAALLASGRDGVMLHPTMIYGGRADANVRRLAALLRRLPVVPLPGGGRSLVQPIHHSDVTRALLAALDREWATPEALAIAGPRPVPYAGFVRAVARAAGLRRPLVVPVPAGALIAYARLARYLPRAPQVDPDEMRRLIEDKAFDVTPMITKLAVTPIPLDEGLARAFRPPEDCRSKE